LAGPGLYVWGGGSLRGARERREAGAVVVAWPGSDERALERDGLPARAVRDVIGAAGGEAAEAAERGFARVWARLPLDEGRSFRDLVTWREESLLWACESYLRRATAGPRCAGTAETCLRLLEALDPSEVDAGGLAPPDALLLSRAAVARGVLFHGEVGRVKPLSPGRAETGAGGAPSGLLARLGSANAAARRSVAGQPLLAVHDAGSAAAGLEALLDRALAEAGLASAVVSLEDLPRHETPRARDAVAGAERSFRETLGRLRGTPGLAASYAHRGVGFAELAACDLEAVLLGHLPGAVRVVERALDLLTAARPALVLVSVKDRDLRRAIGLAARAAGVPWASVLAAASADERVDAGPQPVARLAPGTDGGLAEATARLLAAARDSLGPR
jgi:hypothetical protein